MAAEAGDKGHGVGRVAPSVSAGAAHERQEEAVAAGHHLGVQRPAVASRRGASGAHVGDGHVQGDRSGKDGGDAEGEGDCLIRLRHYRPGGGSLAGTSIAMRPITSRFSSSLCSIWLMSIHSFLGRALWPLFSVAKIWLTLPSGSFGS